MMGHLRCSLKRPKHILVMLFFVLVCYQARAQSYGCTDPLANNFNASANFNDGSCLYNATTIIPLFTYPLDASIKETSGLIYVNEHLVTHNDNDDIYLYSLDTLDGEILYKDSLKACINKEWEEISQDSLYIYLGDFGNNTGGNRTDLHILRIEKSSLTLTWPIIDTIYFSYADQIDFSTHAANTTDYDCESFVVSKDSIYLFTKQWQSKQTVVYVLPKVPGSYSAQPRDTFDVNGLITGATYLEDKRLLVLCGYSNLLLPFTYLCYDFQQHDFFGANKRRLDINSLAIHQIEAIATHDGLKYYMTNESFIQGSLINSPQQFHVFDFSTYLSAYLNQLNTEIASRYSAVDLKLYPNPVENFCWVQSTFKDSYPLAYHLLNSEGKLLFTGTLSNKDSAIDMRKYNSGVYMIDVYAPISRQFQVVKQ